MDQFAVSAAQFFGLGDFDILLVGLLLFLALIFRFNLSAKDLFKTPLDVLVSALFILAGATLFIYFINIGASAVIFIYRDFEGAESSRIEATGRLLTSIAGFVSALVVLAGLIFHKKTKLIGSNIKDFIFDFYKFVAIVYLFIYLQSFLNSTFTTFFIDSETLADLSQGTSKEAIDENNLINISRYFFAVIASVFFLFIKSIVSPFVVKQKDSSEYDNAEKSDEDEGSRSSE
jgi:hypothetical protein